MSARSESRGSESTGKVRVGVVGTSTHAETMHIVPLLSHPGSELVALCGRRRGHTEEVARKHGVPGAYTDYQEMIGSGILDAIVVAGPDDTHHDVAMAALEVGLHVLCEKPLALTVDQAREMRERADAAGVVNMVYHTWRWLPHARFVKRLLDEGYLGRLFEVSLSYVADYGLEPSYAWRFDRARANGVLADLGSHMIDLARYFAGGVGAVSADLATYVERPGPEGRTYETANDSAQLTLGMQSGARAVIHVSAVASVGSVGQEQRITLVGERGTVEAFYPSPGFLVRSALRGEDWRTLEIPADILAGVDPADPFEVFVRQSVGDRAFVDAILEGRRGEPDFADGLRVQEIIGAAIESAASGCVVAI